MAFTAQSADMAKHSRGTPIVHLEHVVCRAELTWDFSVMQSPVRDHRLWVGLTGECRKRVGFTSRAASISPALWQFVATGYQRVFIFTTPYARAHGYGTPAASWP